MMVFLTSIDILDTGFLSKTTRTNQLATSLRVNSGSALRLKGVEFEIDSSANVDKEGFAAQFDNPETPLISANADEFRLTLSIGSRNTDTTNPWGIDDMATITELLRLPKTKGWKAIYYPVSGPYRNREQQLIYVLGNSDTTESQGDIDITLATSTTDTAGTSGFDLTDVPYIAVRFESCKIRQGSSSSTITITLSGVVTG